MRWDRGQGAGGGGTARLLPRRFWLVLCSSMLLVPYPIPHAPCPTAEAAVAKGKNQQLDAAGANQGGGTVTSGKYRQQVSFGEAIAGGRLASARFRVFPGFLGTSFSAESAPPTTELDLPRLYAKTDPLGVVMVPQTWGQANSPIFIWEPPVGGAEIAGYSFALDGPPDDRVDTTDTSFDIATSVFRTLTDGKHTFSVKALNSAGSSGRASTIELWVDTTPPSIPVYAPAPGTLLNAPTPAVFATVTDAASGVTEGSIRILINGQGVPITVDTVTGAVATSGGTWREGANSVELRAADRVGNLHTPLVWSVTVDTAAPTGTVTINAGAQMTTSVFVRLGLSASDATSDVDRVLISNEESAGYVEEPFVAVRAQWKLRAVRGVQSVYVKFKDKAGNVSAPVVDAIDLGLLSPETVLVSGPAGFVPSRSVSFAFMCPEGDCLFSFAFDNEAWSAWDAGTTASRPELVFGNHYFRVKAAKDVNGIPGIQPDEEDPSPAERTWVVGVEPPLLVLPKGPPVKIWRLE